MGGQASRPRDRAAAKSLAVVEEFLGDYHPRDFAVELWDGSRIPPHPGQFCRFTWHIKNPQVLRAVLHSDRQAALGAAFVRGDFDISGDIMAIFPVAEYLDAKHWSAAEKFRIGGLLFGLYGSDDRSNLAAELGGQLHSKSRDRGAVTFHYDVSNQFYELWLDRRMAYSCAYFEDSNDSLDDAQEQKLDYICRKLRLRRGQRLLDIGCGWGGLIIHAAQKCGVDTVGITLSANQASLARERIADAGLSSQCEIRLMDYREAAQLGQFDKIVSVGMVEHVGENKLPEYFRTAFRLLKPGGVFLNHGIGRAGNRPKRAEKTFTDAYVFPDGELVPIATMLLHAEEAGFEVRDVENLREHYFLTLVRWLRQLEASEAQARGLIGDFRYRIWRLYLAGSAYYFLTGKLDLYQSLLIKASGGNAGMPLTRADWYLTR
jgi:cyclopropane-fatty-acyl-phospholipid synthase